MADLKFIGVNLPSIKVQKQADPATDALLIDKIRPRGGLSGAMVVEPIASTTGANLTVFRILDGPGGSQVLDITVNNLATKFVHTLSGDLTVTDDASVGNDLTVLGDALVNGQITGAEVWADNSTDFSYSRALVLDPSTSPSYGSDGTASIYLGTGSADPSVTGFAASAGSLLLNLDGSAWLKTGVTDSDWDILFTSGSVSVDLDNVIAAAPVDNDVTVPAASRLIFRDGAGTFSGTDSLMEISRTTAGAGTGLSVVMSASSGPGISVSHSGTAEASDITQDGSATNIAVWRSGAGAANQRMTLTRTGVLTANADETADSNVGGAPFAANQLLLATSGGGVGTVGVLSASGDPAAGTGIAAAQGSLALGTDGILYVKEGAAATNWAAVITASGYNLQTAYNGGNTVTLAAATPLAVTTSGVGQDGITVSDGIDTVTIRGDDVLLSASGILSWDAAGGNQRIYRTSTTTMSFAIGAAERARIDSNGFYTGANYSWLGDTDTRVRRVVEDQIALYTGGADLAVFNAQAAPAGGGTGDHTFFGLTGTAAAQVAGDSWTLISGDVTDGAAGGTKRLVELGVGGTPLWAVDETGTLVTGIVPSSSMSFPLLAPNGSATAPSYSFSAQPGSGFYRNSVGGHLGLAIAGTQYVEIRTDGIFPIQSSMKLGQNNYRWLSAHFQNGSNAAPAVAFGPSGFDQTGMYSPGNNQVAIATGATQMARWSAGQYAVADGAVGTPAYTFLSQTTTGIWWPTSNHMGFSSGGTEVFRIRGATTPQIAAADGTELAPVYSFQGGTSMGWYRSASTLNASVGGAKILQIDAGGIVVPDGSATDPSIAFSSDNTEGLYRYANNAFAYTAGISPQIIFSASSIRHVDVGTAAAPTYSFISASGTGMRSNGSGVLLFSQGGNDVATYSYAPTSADGKILFIQGNPGGSGGDGVAALTVDIADSGGGSAVTSLGGIHRLLDLRVAGVTKALITSENLTVTPPRSLAGALLVSDGTEAEPSLGFLSDLDSGFYLQADGDVGVSIAGVRRAEILSTGIRAYRGSDANPGVGFLSDPLSGVDLSGGLEVELLDHTVATETTRGTEAAAVDPRQGWRFYDLTTPWIPSATPRVLPDGGIFAELQKTNQVGYSSDLTNWSLVNTPGGVAAASGPAPDGSTYYEVTDSTGVSTTYVGITTGTVGANAVAISVYVPKDTDTDVYPEINVRGAGATLTAVGVQINTCTGEMAVRTGSADYTKAHDAGDWWRFEVGVTPSVSGTLDLRLYAAVGSRASGFPSVDNTAQRTVGFWGVQVEDGGYASSPIRTDAGSPVTRGYDSHNIDNLEVDPRVYQDGSIFEVDFWPNRPSADLIATTDSNTIYQWTSFRRLRVSEGTGGNVGIVTAYYRASVGIVQVPFNDTYVPGDRITLRVSPGDSLSIYKNGQFLNSGSIAAGGSWDDVSANDLQVGRISTTSGQAEGVVGEARFIDTNRTSLVHHGQVVAAAQTGSFEPGTDLGTSLGRSDMRWQDAHIAGDIYLGGSLIGGDVSWPLLAPDGSAGAPSYSWANDTQLGFYRFSAGNLAFGVAASPIIRFNSGGIIPATAGVGTSGSASRPWAESNANLIVARANGSASAPAFTFGADLDTGLFWQSSGQLDFATNTANVFRISSTAVTPGTTNDTISLGSGSSRWENLFLGPGLETAGAISIGTAGFFGGIYQPADGQLAISTEGAGGNNVQIMRWEEQQAPNEAGAGAHVFAALTGDASAQTSTDGWTGLKVDVTDSASTGIKNLIDLQTGSTSQFYVSQTGRVRYGSGSETNPSLSFVAETNMGFYRGGSGTTRFAIGGSARYQFASGSFIPMTDGTQVLGGASFRWSQLHVADGTTAEPGVRFSGSAAGLGIRSSVANTMAFVAGGADVATVQFGQLNMSSGKQFRADVGSAGAPGISFVAENTTGIYRGSAGILSVATLGTARATFSSSGLLPASTGLYPLGSASFGWARAFFSLATSLEGTSRVAEFLQFNTTGTGAEEASILVSNEDPNGNVTSGEVGSLLIDATNAELYQKTAAPSTWVAIGPSAGASFPLLAPDGAVTAPSYAFSGATGVGMYRNAGGSLAFSSGGSAPDHVFFVDNTPPNGSGVRVFTTWDANASSQVTATDGWIMQDFNVNGSGTGTANKYYFRFRADGATVGGLQATEEGTATINPTIKLGVGTSDHPTYTFWSDPNTGVWSAAPDVLALTAGGESVLVDNDAATPIFRPATAPATAGWLLGQSTFPWAQGFFHQGTQSAPSIMIWSGTGTIQQGFYGYGQSIGYTYNGDVKLFMSQLELSPDNGVLLDLGNTSQGWEHIYVEDGTPSLPAYAFSNNADVGFLYDATYSTDTLSGAPFDDVVLQAVVNGTVVTSWRINNGQGSLMLPNGQNGDPSLYWEGDINTGFYLAEFEVVGLTISDGNGNYKWDEFAYYPDTATATNIGSLTANFGAGRFWDHFYGENNAAGDPTYTFGNDPDTGMYRATTNTIGWSTGGIARMTLNTAELAMLGGHALNMGSGEVIFSTAGAGGDTKIYGTTDTIVFNANGYDVVMFGSNGPSDFKVQFYGVGTNPSLGTTSNQWSEAYVDVYYADTADSATAPSYSWWNDTDTGIFNAAANVIGFTAGNSERMRLSATTLQPASNGFISLGTATVGFEDIYVNNDLIPISNGVSNLGSDTKIFNTLNIERIDLFDTAEAYVASLIGSTTQPEFNFRNWGKTFYVRGELAPTADQQGSHLSIAAGRSGASAAASVGKAGGDLTLAAGQGGNAADASSTAGDGGDTYVNAGLPGATGAGAAGTPGILYLGQGTTTTSEIISGPALPGIDWTHRGLFTVQGEVTASTGTELGAQVDLTVNKAAGTWRALALSVDENGSPGNSDSFLYCESDTGGGMTHRASISEFGTYLASNGSFQFPAYTFVSDSTVGMFYGGTDLVGIGVGDETVYFDNNTGGDPELRGHADNTWILGSASERWKNVYAVTTTIGDLNMKSLHDDAHWTLNEDRTGIYVHDRKTGKKYKLLMEEVTEAPEPLPLEKVS